MPRYNIQKGGEININDDVIINGSKYKITEKVEKPETINFYLKEHDNKHFQVMSEENIQYNYYLASKYECDVLEEIKPDNWFSKLFGFNEMMGKIANYDKIRKNIFIEDDPDNKENKILKTCIPDEKYKQYKIGKFTTPQVGTLTESAIKSAPPPVKNKVLLTLKIIEGGPKDEFLRVADPADVFAFHQKCPYSTIQAASQLNTLEFASPTVTPENGITGYAGDMSQGPVCAIACGPGTLYRNYFCQMGEDVKRECGNITFQYGQTKTCQINNLDEFEKKINNSEEKFFSVKNGYTDTTNNQRLRTISRILGDRDTEKYNELLDLIKVGIHDDVQVTCKGRNSIEIKEHVVTQVYASACSVAYTMRGKSTKDKQIVWESLSRIVLDAMYQGTLAAGLLNYMRHKDNPTNPNYSDSIFLTMLGGGFFGNNIKWITDAILKACDKFKYYPLKVYVISYSKVEDSVSDELKGFNGYEKIYHRKFLGIE